MNRDGSRLCSRKSRRGKLFSFLSVPSFMWKKTKKKRSLFFSFYFHEKPVAIKAINKWEIGFRKVLEMVKIYFFFNFWLFLDFFLRNICTILHLHFWREIEYEIVWTLCDGKWGKDTRFPLFGQAIKGPFWLETLFDRWVNHDGLGKERGGNCSKKSRVKDEIMYIFLFRLFLWPVGNLRWNEIALYFPERILVFFSLRKTTFTAYFLCSLQPFKLVKILLVQRRRILQLFFQCFPLVCQVYTNFNIDMLANLSCSHQCQLLGVSYRVTC